MTVLSKILDTDDNRIHVEFTEEIGGDRLTITAWPQPAEELGLLGPGQKEVNGVELIEEEPCYQNEKTQERIVGYVGVVLAFADADTMERASECLNRKATERFESGVSDVSHIRDFAGAIPDAERTAP